MKKFLEPADAQQINAAVREFKKALIAADQLKERPSQIAAIESAEVNLSAALRHNKAMVTALTQAELIDVKNAQLTKSSITVGNVADRNSAPITPFELVSIAAILAARERTNSTEASKVEDYFPAARQALDRAKAYLSELVHGSNERFFQVLGVRSYTFHEVLKPLPSQPIGQKRPKTMVGGITTHAGLIKAIKRVFPEAQSILDSRVLLSSQIDEIRRDHEQRMQARTQAATAARKKGARRIGKNHKA